MEKYIGSRFVPGCLCGTSMSRYDSVKKNSNAFDINPFHVTGFFL